MSQDRISTLRSLFPVAKIDAYLVTFLPHLRYLTGFSGSNGVGIITSRSAYFVTDGRYEEQVKQEVSNCKTAIAYDYNLFELIKKNRWLRAEMVLGFDGSSMSYSQFKAIKKLFPQVKFKHKPGVVEQLTSVKDEDEIALIKKAVAITDKVYQEILPLIKPGVMESDIAAEITYRHRKHGAEADAFQAIVASGSLSALPHARASSKKIKKGDMVTLDFGCIYNGYHSDMTRTVSVGKPHAEMQKIYQIVFDAQQKSIDSAKAGVLAKDLNAVAKEYIKQKGYEKFFNHSLGHGIGLQIHEAPKISAASKAELQINNVVTIEPGIYLPGLGGVRIEDDVIIKESGCEILTQSPKELTVL